MNSRRIVMVATLFALVGALTGCGAVIAAKVAPTTTPIAGKRLVIGEVSADPTKKTERFQPLADYLGAHLAAYDINAGEVRIAPDFDTMVQMLKNGEIDMVVDSPYPAMIISDLSGAEPILRRWKGGDAEYSTVFISRADSTVVSLADLAGSTIGFEEAFSTSGYFLPLVHLLDAGMKPAEKRAAETPVNEHEVGYVFTGDEENTVQWVISGKVVAGAVDSRTFADIPAESREQLRVFSETERVPRHIVMVRPGIDPELRDAVKQLLLGLEQSPDGPQILTTFEKTLRFDEFTAETSLARMRALYARIPKP